MLLVHPVQEVVRAAARAARPADRRQQQRPRRLWALAGVAIAIGAGHRCAGSRRATGSRPSRSRSAAGCCAAGCARSRATACGPSTSARTRCTACSASPASTVGTGRSDRGADGGLRLDGLDVVRGGAACATSCCHRPPRTPGRPPRPARPGARRRGRGPRRPRRPRPSSPGCDPAWLALRAVHALGHRHRRRHRRASRSTRPTTRTSTRADIGPLGDARRRARRACRPRAWSSSVARGCRPRRGAVLDRPATSSRSGASASPATPGGTLHVARGLLSTRATTIEERRLRGVELSEPLLLRWARRRALRRDRHRPAGRPRRRARRLAAVPARPARRSPRASPADVLRTGDPLDRPAHAARPARPPAPLHPRAGRRRRDRRGRDRPAPIVDWPTWVWAVARSRAPGRRGARRRPRPEPRPRRDRRPRSSRAAGSLVRRRAMLAREGIIGVTLSRSFFQRRAGLVHADGDDRRRAPGLRRADVPDDEALRVCDAAVPGLLDAVPRGALARAGTPARGASRARPRSGR